MSALFAIDEALAALRESAPWHGINPDDEAVILGLQDARHHTEWLLIAARDMYRLAKGPAGGVTQQQKREILGQMELALARMEGNR